MGEAEARTAKADDVDTSRPEGIHGLQDPSAEWPSRDQEPLDLAAEGSAERARVVGRDARPPDADPQPPAEGSADAAPRPMPAGGSTFEDIAALQRALADGSNTRTSFPEPGASPRARPGTSDHPMATGPRAIATSRRRMRFAAGAALGHYEVIRPLGQGGMGEVYLARDTRLGRRVALKFLLNVDAQRSARFLVEAQATAQLAHENIVALHDIAEHEGLPYMVLEYVPGKTLAAWLQERVDDGRSAGVPPLRAAELMLPVVQAVQRAHEAGIVHRDLKPANVMLADSGTMKVLDFGIAKLVGDGAVEPSDARSSEVALGEPETRAGDGAALAALTMTGSIVGTRAYMAPEQWLGEPVDGRADLWAIGMMLYQLVTGEHPLAPLSPETIASVARRDVPMPSVRERLPEIGRLGAVIDRCLIKPKADRLGSAQELREELEAIVRPHAGAQRGGSDEANPYTGLAAFQERDAARFFGRETMVEQVVARLVDQPLLALVGSSGAGKSSLVRAGIIPALKRGGDAWEAFVLRPGPRPLAALAELLLHHSWLRSSQSVDAMSDGRTDPLASLGENEEVVARLREEPGFLGVQVRSRARRRRERVLLFVDQFEEVYTLASESEREAFLACLAGAADDASSPLRVLVSIRHDFLDRVASSSSALAELVSRGTVLVGPLDRRGMRSALVGPAESVEHRFESEALVDEMLDALAGAASALPLLQFTAAKLWEGRDRDRRTLTEATYRAFGGVGGALASHADSVLGAMSAAERRCARTLLLRLVTPERTRAIVTRRELLELGGATTTELDRVLDRLIGARLLTVEGGGRDESTVEMLHESLIVTWPALVRWLEEEQEDAQFRARLRGAAKEWDASGCTEGLLWRGEAAEEARRWRARQGPDAAAGLSAREVRYLAAVVALDERDRRRKRRLFAALIGGLSLVLVIVSALAVRSKQAAERAAAEAAEAERSAASARNATRLAAARQRQEDPTTALALLRELEPGAVPQGWAELARWSLGTNIASAVLFHEAAVRAVGFSPDGKRIVSASSDCAVRIWNADGMGEPLVLRGHDGDVTAAAWSPDGKRIVSSSVDKTVRIWNADGTGQPLVLRGHGDVVHAAAWSPDGQRVASASADKTVRIWNADGTGQPLVLRGHQATILNVAWSPDARRIASTSWDKTVRVWNADGTGEPITLSGTDAAIQAVAWSPDGQRVVTGAGDATVRVWNADGTGQPLIARGHTAPVSGVEFSPDGRRILSASWDRTMRLWNANDLNQPVVVFQGHDDRLTSVAFSRDGERIASGSMDRTVRVWSTNDPNRSVVLRGHESLATSVTWSPDGKRIATGSFDKSVRIWNADGTGHPIVLRGREALSHLAWSPDGERLAITCIDKTVRVWTADGSAELVVLRGHEDFIDGVAWSPDGNHIVTSSHDKTARIWDADGMGEPIVLRGHSNYLVKAAFSPDGDRVVTASIDKTARIWNADGTGEPIVLRGHEDAVYAAVFSPDGGRVATASADETIRVWNADGTGQPLVLRGHGATIMSLMWSPDGKRLLSASIDGTVRVWNADGTGEPLGVNAPVPVSVAAWSPDGQRIAVTLADNTIMIFGDFKPLDGASDPKLWTATSYCIPLKVRQRLLSFSEAQARADLERCQRRVREAQAAVAPGR